MKAKWIALITIGLSVMSAKAQSTNALPTTPWVDQWSFGGINEIYEQDLVPVMWVDPLGFTKVSPLPIRNVPGFNAAVDARIFANTPVVQGGVTAASGLITQTITLGFSMPDNTYSVSAHSTVSTLNLLPTTKTTTNFTLTLPLGLGGNINWILVDY